MNVIDGRTLASCFDVVSKVGRELEIMAGRLESLLKDGIGNDPAFPFVISTDHGHSEWPSRDTEDGWVYTDIAFNLPLKLRGSRRHRADRYIGFQVSMNGDGIAIPGNDEPLLHMFSWGGETPIDFHEENYIGFPFEDVEGSGEDPYEVQANRIMTWSLPGQASRIYSWNYSLRLLTLADESALKRYCVCPALKLLQGTSILDALPDSFLEQGMLVQLPDKAILSGRVQPDAD